MAVAKRQGRKKSMKIEQRQIKGGSGDLSEDLRQNKQHSWLAQFTQGRHRGRKKHIKREAKGGAKGLSFTLSFFLLHTGLHIWVMITHLEPDILECEVKWALESITTIKASGGDGIPVELFQILKDDAVKVLYSVCQQIWKTQQWPQHCKRSVFIPECLALCE